MSSALANSLALLGEIRNQLNHSKGNVLRHTSPTKPDKDIYKSSDRKIKAVSHNYSAEKINSSAEFPHGLSAGKEHYVEGRYPANAVYGNHVDLLSQIKSSFTPVPSGGEKFEKKFSSDKRAKKFREKPGYLDLDNDSLELKSSEMAENLKKNIQKEMENFNNDCNDILSKINAMIDSISKERLSEEESESSEEDRKSKNAKKAAKPKAGMSDNLSHSIKNLNKKFEKLVEDLEDKKYKSNAFPAKPSESNNKRDNKSNSVGRGKDASKSLGSAKEKYIERRDSFGERRAPSGEDSDF